MSRRTAHERQVLAFLRGAVPRLVAVDDQSDIADAFATLTDELRLQGVSFFPVGSPFTSEDEIAILTDLAIAQRYGMQASRQEHRPHHSMLARCATLLREAGLWLPLGASVPAEPLTPRAYHPASIDQGRIRARAVSLARSRQLASTGDFVAAGISRQYLSRLCKDGYLQRVRHGWYQAVPVQSGQADPARMPASSARHLS